MRTRSTMPASRAAARRLDVFADVAMFGLPALLVPAHVAQAFRPARLAALTDCATPALHGHDPVSAEIERQLFVEAIDESRAVLVEERDESNRAFLRVAAGKGQRAGMHEL